MASIMKIRDNEGNIIEIPVLKGNKGDTGASSKIVGVTATIDDSEADAPSVTVTMGGTEEEVTLDFVFSGLNSGSGAKISHGNVDLEAGVSELAEGEV